MRVSAVFGLGRRREARLAAVWGQALEEGGHRSPLQGRPYTRCRCLGQVVGHRQRARTGTKAWVRWVADGQTTAAWFWKARPAVGAYILAIGEYGHGTHHPESVFYVAAGDFVVIPAWARRAHTRHQRRTLGAPNTDARWRASSARHAPSRSSTAPSR